MSDSHSDGGKPYAYANDYLIVRKGRKETRVKAWNPPVAEQRSELSPVWESCTPDFVLVPPRARQKRQKAKDIEQQTFFFFNDPAYSQTGRSAEKAEKTSELRLRALDALRGSMPENVVNLLSPFRIGQWQLLVLLYHDQGAIELAESNPMLAFLLAMHLDGDVERIRQEQFCQRRRRDILAEMGMPATMAAVRIVNKLMPKALSNDNWRRCVEVLRTELRKEKTLLTHVPQINYGVLEIVADPIAEAAAGATLLEEVSADHRELSRSRVVHMIKSAIDMQEQLDDEEERPVTRFQTMKRLHTVHSKATAKYRRRVRQLSAAQMAASVGPFIDAPFPGIPGQIEPIDSPEALVAEGELQNNCVSSYAKKIANGELYIYRILTPERATLSIVKKKNGWEIGELEIKNNSPAGRQTEVFVKRWLRDQQK